MAQIISPFIKYCSTLGIVPSTYEENLTYIECLNYLIKFLNDTVIPAFNENDAAFAALKVDNAKFKEDLTAEFNELKDYVDTYFENLDVQEEINNKLDEMAESGVLSDIVAQYIQLAGVLAYDTIADMAAAENLTEGSTARVLGNTSYDNGDGAYYKIRTLTNTDVVDGVNIVAITHDPTLVAERVIGQYHFVVPSGADATYIQKLINIEGEKVIEFKAGETYELDGPLYLTSGTHLELNNAVIYFNFIGDYGETIGIYGYKLDSTYTGYNGVQDASIKNGYIKQGSIAIMHNNGFTLENVEFTDTYCRHCIQIAGSKDVTINKCIFNGTYYDMSVENSSEAINIDPTVYGAQPYAPSDSPMFDGTYNNGIYITECYFKVPSDARHKLTVCIGSHAESSEIYTFNLRIEKCQFETPYCWAFGLRDMQDVIIRDNVLNGDPSLSRPDGTYFILTRNLLNNVIIDNNNVNNILRFFQTGSVILTKNNISISNNVVKTVGNDSTKPSMIVSGVNKMSITNNTFSGEAILLFITETGTYTNSDFVIVGNSFTTSSSYSLVGCRSIANLYINDNTFTNTIGSTNVSLSIDAGTVTGAVVTNNKTNNCTKFCELSALNQNFSNNNAIWQVCDFASASTSRSDDFDHTVTHCKRLLVLVGSGTNTQLIEIGGFLNNGDFIDDRTYKFALVNDDNSAGYGSLVVSNTGTEFTYTGSLGIRCIFGKN